MNKKIFLSCILCNKFGANFQCERCNETYCSKDCQVIHWPMHRRLCFPMPNLIAVENPVISINHSPASHQYSAQREIATEWNPSENMKRSYSGKKSHNQIVSHKSRSITQAYNLPSEAFAMCTGSSSTEKFNAAHSVSFSSLDESLMETNSQLRKWSEEFLFGAVTEVIVQYFTESPTSNCWVIQRKDVERRNAILKNLNFHRSFDTIDSEAVQVNSVYNVQFEGVCHRGVVLHRINSREVWIRLIDNGRSFRTRMSAMRALNQVRTDVKGLAFEINFETLRSTFVDEVLRVENISYDSDGVINVRIVEEEKIFTDNDIESVPLPEDLPIEMFCLDSSNISKGYISACENHRKRIESICGISDKIAQYCKKSDDDKDYCPKLNELCLAYVEGERQWYRAKCVENVMPNTFKLEMIDYGLLEDVSSKNIRRMVKDFMDPLLMQQCIVYGVPARPDKITEKKMIGWFNRNQIFCIKRARLLGGHYIIYVPELQKIINE